MSYHLTNPNIPRLEIEVLEYCKKNNIIDFPKKKNGKPDFRKKQIKDILRYIYKDKIENKKQQILNKNKQENINNFSNHKEYNYRDEIINMNENELKNF